MEPQYFDLHADEEPITVRFPDGAKTYGVNTCIGIAILDRAQRIGYLGHYLNTIDADGGSVPFKELLHTAIAAARQIGDLEVVLAGNALDPRTKSKNYKLLIERERAYGKRLIEYLLAEGIQKRRLRTHLNGHPYQGYDLTIDTDPCAIVVDGVDVDDCRLEELCD